MTPPFDAVHHVCIVVPDIDAAIAFYEKVGIGGWQDFPPLSAFTDLDVPDLDAFLDLTYKYTDAPGLQLQLCEPGPGNSPQRQFLDRTGGGVFHIGFVVDDVDAGAQAARAVGLEPWMYGRRPDSTGFTYLQTPPSAGATLEIRQSPNS